MSLVGINGGQLDAKTCSTSRTVRHQIKFVAASTPRATQIDCLIRNYQSLLAHAHSQHQRAKEQLQKNVQVLTTEKAALVHLIHGDPKLAQAYHTRLPFESVNPQSLCKGCRSKLTDDVRHKEQSKPKNQPQIPKSPDRKDSRRLYGSSNRSTTDLSQQQDQVAQMEFSGEKLFIDPKCKELTDSLKNYRQRVETYSKENIRLKEQNFQLTYQVNALKEYQQKYEQVTKISDKIQQNYKDKIRSYENKAGQQSMKRKTLQSLLTDLNQEKIKGEISRLNAKYKLKYY